MSANPRKTLLAITLLALWGAAMLSAFWWYEARYLRSFGEQTALFQGDVLQLPRELAGPGPIRLVHFWDPASPAVAIWDHEGRLAYFGPYSEGAVCTSSNSFIEPILEALADGRPVSAGNTLAVGCFCQWASD